MLQVYRLHKRFGAGTIRQDVFFARGDVGAGGCEVALGVDGTDLFKHYFGVFG